MKTNLKKISPTKKKRINSELDKVSDIKFGAIWPLSGQSIEEFIKANDDETNIGSFVRGCKNKLLKEIKKKPKDFKAKFEEAKENVKVFLANLGYEDIIVINKKVKRAPLELSLSFKKEFLDKNSDAIAPLKNYIQELIKIIKKK